MVVFFPLGEYPKNHQNGSADYIYTQTILGFCLDFVQPLGVREIRVDIISEGMGSGKIIEVNNSKICLIT